MVKKRDDARSGIAVRRQRCENIKQGIEMHREVRGSEFEKWAARRVRKLELPECTGEPGVILIDGYVKSIKQRNGGEGLQLKADEHHR